MDIRVINVIGAGSLGSFTAFLLSKMSHVFNCPIKVMDFDVVEEHNVENQLYKENHVGLPKIEALRQIIENICDAHIVVENKKVDKNIDLRGIVVVLVDKMSVRNEIFESCRFNAGIDYLIEARTGEDNAQVYAFDPKDPDWCKKYKLFLYEDLEAQAPPCANPQTIPTLWAVASVIAKLIVRFKSQEVFTNEFFIARIGFKDWPSIDSTVSEEI